MSSFSLVILSRRVTFAERSRRDDVYCGNREMLVILTAPENQTQENIRCIAEQLGPHGRRCLESGNIRVYPPLEDVAGEPEQSTTRVIGKRVLTMLDSDEGNGPFWSEGGWICERRYLTDPMVEFVYVFVQKEPKQQATH